MKTVDTPQKEETEDSAPDNDIDELEENKDEAGLYRHIKESEEGVSETVDAATKVRKIYDDVRNYCKTFSHVGISYYSFLNCDFVGASRKATNCG